jgi:hypothetical protein
MCSDHSLRRRPLLIGLLVARSKRHVVIVPETTGDPPDPATSHLPGAASSSTIVFAYSIIGASTCI